MKKTSGLILIELILATTLGLLLIGFLLEIYLTSQKNFQLQTQLKNIQDSGKMVIAILHAEVHQAGHIGCIRLTNTTPIISPQGYSITKKNRLTGNQSEIVVRKMEGPVTTLREAMHDAVTVKLRSDIHVSPNDRLVIADCEHVEIFQVKAVNIFSGRQQITSLQPLHFHFAKQAEVGKLAIKRFFVAKTKYKDVEGKPIFSLFVKGNGQARVELVSGINRIQFTYSIKKNRQIIDLPFNEITDWSQVIGIALSLDLAQGSIFKTWHAYISLED